jgi:uncharacterized NAD(P)/FAD-binding protein YdhS
VTHTVCIVGGGFCGAMTALHLLRDFPDLPLRMEIVEPRPVLGAGLAYSTTDPEHRINVAAARMSPFVEDELHFDRWLRAQGVPERDPRAMLPDGRLFVRRAEVGSYVSGMLREAQGRTRAITLRHLRQRAVSAAPSPGGFVVGLADGEIITAHIVVLAVGHPPPLLPAVLRPLAGDRRLVADPWDVAALDAIPRDAPVLIVGTGLTAHDVVASLRARGHVGALLAISRRGLLSRARTNLPVEPVGDFSSDPATTAAALLRRVRRTIAACRDAGQPWENVIDALRRQGSAVWGTLPPVERHRLLRHLRPFWDVHRFQVAPQISEMVARDIAVGALVVMAASLQAAWADTDALVVRLRPRGGTDAAIEKRFGAIVACVGPGHASVVDSNAVLRSLRDHGLLHADPYGLGIAVDSAARCLTAHGDVAENLFVAGPLARGTDGELMGLPQVSTQPRAVAARIASLLAHDSVA